MRTEKKLWLVVLDYPELFNGGLCLWIINLRTYSVISKEEYRLLDDVLEANQPDWVFNKEYWWQVGYITPRIEWIKNRIRQLHNEN